MAYDIVPFTVQEVIDAYAEYDCVVGPNMAQRIADDLNMLAAERGEQFAFECLRRWAANDAQEAEADSREAADFEDWAYGPRDEE